MAHLNRPRKVKINWPPTPEKPDHYKDKDGQTVHHKSDGEPSFIRMKRWENDQSLRGDAIVSCCDCGLRHLYSYELIRLGKEWWLIKRAYRV